MLFASSASNDCECTNTLAHNALAHAGTDVERQPTGMGFAMAQTAGEQRVPAGVRRLQAAHADLWQHGESGTTQEQQAGQQTVRCTAAVRAAGRGASGCAANHATQDALGATVS